MHVESHRHDFASLSIFNGSKHDAERRLVKDDLRMDEEQVAVFEKLSYRAIKNLNKKYINACYVQSKSDARSAIMKMIPEGVRIGTADSLSLLQVGIFHAIRERGKNDIINPFMRDERGNFVVTQEERVAMMTQVFLSDVFLAGTNAVTIDGKLVNTDGFGNRVSAMIFGPKKVIIVIGANKIVKDLDTALQRIRMIAPINATRHATKHNVQVFKELPCVDTGICVNCNNPHRICHYTTIIDGEQQRRQGHLNVVIVGETLGI